VGGGVASTVRPLGQRARLAHLTVGAGQHGHLVVWRIDDDGVRLPARDRALARATQDGEKPATSARLRIASLLRPTTGTERPATSMRIISVTISSRSVKPRADRAARRECLRLRLSRLQRLPRRHVGVLAFPPGVLSAPSDQRS